AEQHAAEEPHPHARTRGKRDRASRSACRRQQEAVHAGVEVAERLELLAEGVDAPIVRAHSRLEATNAESSRSRSAFAPNGASAPSAVAHSSAASCRAPSTPLNDTKVVFRASARTALPVSAGSPATSRRSSTIWNASPRFFAYADSAAIGSAAAPAA